MSGGGWPADARVSSAAVRVEDQVQERCRAPGLDLAQQAAEPLEHDRGRHAVERICPQPASELAHDRRGVEAAAHDVADGEAEPAIGQREGVEPVPAEPRGGGGEVAAGERHGGQLGQARQEAALKRIRQAALLLGQAAEDGERGAVGGALEELLVLVVEGPLVERAHVQHAHHGALHEQRDAEHRARGPSRAGSGSRPAPPPDSGCGRAAGSPRCGPRSRVRRGCARRARPPPRAPWRREGPASCRRPRAGGSRRCPRRGSRPRA